MAIHGSGNPTWVDFPDTSTLIDAEALENLENLLDRLRNPPVFSGHQTIAQTLPTVGSVLIAFDGETIDTHDGHSTTTDNTRWVVPAGWAGLYSVTAKVMFNGNLGRRATYIFKNGAAVVGGLSVAGPPPGGSGNQSSSAVMRLLALVPGDYIEVSFYQDSGTAWTTTPGGTEFASSLDIFYVRPTPS